MKEDTKNIEDEIIEQLTNKELRELTERISAIYLALTQQDWPNDAVEKALVRETRSFLLLDAKILKRDNESNVEKLRIMMNGDLTFLAEELRETGKLHDKILHALALGIDSDNAAREPEDVSPDALGLD